ncbi:MAG: hypothetical protein K2H29_08235 [Oscillospiraceae bacterium]|nr:hypothetical protein [Oscillospiraceae bacterium]
MEDLLGKMQELLADPETMKQVSELAEMLKDNNITHPENSQNSQDLPDHHNSNTNSNNNINFLSPEILMKAGELLNQNKKPDKNMALLLALRPHLRQQRRNKIDNAVKLLQLWGLFKNLQQTGILQNLLS